MKSLTTRIGLAVLIIVGVALTATAQLSRNARITLDSNLDARATFEAIGQAGGLNVITHRNLPPGALRFQVQGASLVEALDLLSTQTRTFWTRWEDKTILVFPESLQSRRDFERQLLWRIAVDRAPEEVLRELRDNHQIRGVKGTGNTVLIRDVAPRIKLAEQVLGKTGTPVGNGDLDHVYLTEGSTFGTQASVRSQLKIKTPGPVSLNVEETDQATFEKLAQMGGLNVIFPRGYPNRTHSFRIDNVEFFDALDLLAVNTGAFWQPINETTIEVLEDTQQNRRDFASHLAESIYLPPTTSTQDLNSIMASLRTLLSLRGIYQYEPAKAIFIHDGAAMVAIVEALIAEMTGAPVRKTVTSSAEDPFSETGGQPRTSADVRSKLQLRSARSISLRMSAPTSQVFANLSTVAGLNLLFSPLARNNMVTFNAEGLNVIDTLDLLARQTGTFWQPLDSRTIQVLEDTQQNRRDYATRVVKIIYLPVGTSTNEQNGIMNVLRTAMSLRGVYQYDPGKAILIADTPNRIAFAEKMIGQLNIHPAPITSVFIPARGLTETGFRSMASVARSELRVATAGPISINLNQSTQGTYEALAQIAGLTVTFDPRMMAGAPVALGLEGVDVLDALDYLSLQTRTFWKPVDDHTILVAPDTQQAHSELDVRVSKVFYLTSIRDSNATSSVVNLLRTALSYRQIEAQSPGVIAISDTPQRIILAEQIITELDKAR